MKIVLIMLSFAMKYLFISIHFKSTRSKPVLKVRGEGRFRPHQHRQMFFENLSTPEATLLVCQNVFSLKMRSFTITVYETVYGLVFETPRNSRKVTALCIYTTVHYAPCTHINLHVIEYA